MTEQPTRAVEFGPVEILLVEDNPADVRLTMEALNSDRLWNHLSVTRDGVEAMAYLRREGKFAAAARPDLILLDLNLPKKDGREVLAEIKASTSTCRRRMAARCWRRSRPMPTSCGYRL